MTRLRLGIMGFCLATSLCLSGEAPASITPTPSAVPAALQTEIARLAKGAGGTVGVAAWRLDGTGPQLLLNPDEAFPMASTFKVAVASRILERVDKGELRLDQMLDVPPEAMVPSEVLADRFIHPGVRLSVHNLLELMLTQSDNSATDVLTAAAGGPGAVTDWLRRQGIADQRVDRDTATLLRDFFGLQPGPFAQALEAVPDKAALLARSNLPDPKFDRDPRDTSTPRAMATLLTRIFTGKALSPESTRAITAIMARCRTGGARLRAILPKGTPVANKTGTIGGTINDVGVITLPDGSALVIAVFVKESAAPVADRERTIAEIARTAFDYYLIAGSSK